jgi:PPK2 family polyphosphate:nucleotide phosphotransferase
MPKSNPDGPGKSEAKLSGTRAQSRVSDDAKTLAKILSTWQVPPVAVPVRQAPPKPAAKAFSLAGLSPDETPFSSGDKARDKQAVEAMASEIDSLQNLFYADKRFKLLVILQGTDTSGKDGTLRSVFGRISPLGVNTSGWKAPTEHELAHDYLWRIHQRVPAAGEIMIFNRSHYEDVLVPAVSGWITPAQTDQRFAQINDFERMLCETGTVILKFMLHIGFDEQRERLQERIDDPSKHWKFSLGDLDTRKQWPQYQQAYQNLLTATSTPWAPWTVVPANSKTHRNLMIAQVVRSTLISLNLRYPPGDPALENLKVT